MNSILAILVVILSLGCNDAEKPKHEMTDVGDAALDATATEIETIVPPSCTCQNVPGASATCARGRCVYICLEGLIPVFGAPRLGCEVCTPGEFEPPDCGGRDVDCDGDLEYARLYYLDEDEDGFGTGGPFGLDCNNGTPALSMVGGDCDDTDPLINPDAVESCQTNSPDCTVCEDAKDNDCDGLIDTDEDACSR